MFFILLHDTTKLHRIRCISIYVERENSFVRYPVQQRDVPSRASYHDVQEPPYGLRENVGPKYLDSFKIYQPSGGARKRKTGKIREEERERKRRG